jgi:hypothetical protein
VSTLSATAVVLVAGAAPSSAAPTFAVIDPTDSPDAKLDGTCAAKSSGLCTLRAAIQEAEAAGGGDVVLSAGIGDYDLTIPAGAESTGQPSNETGDLDISTHVTVTGSGPDISVIDGMNAVRIFDVHQGGFLRLAGVTLQHGNGDFDGKSGHSHGGAIHNHGTISLDRVALVDSSSPGTWGGGGLTNAGTGVALLQNVTVARNSAARGGGIENLGDLRMLNVTVTDNTSSNGGGIFTAAGSTASATNTLVAKNAGGAQCAMSGTVNSGGYNLQGDASCAFTQSTDRLGDPGFVGGGFNGEPIFYPLLSTSQAVDTGSPLSCPNTDVRGVVRPQDGNGDSIALCDIGSYEREAAGQPLVAMRDARRREGGRTTRKIRFKVSLSARSKHTVKVRATTQDGTAQAGSDYLARNVTLKFKPHQRHKRFTVRVISDHQHEPDETFKVRLSAPARAVIGDPEAIGTIIDDD